MQLLEQRVACELSMFFEVVQVVFLAMNVYVCLHVLVPVIMHV